MLRSLNKLKIKLLTLKQRLVQLGAFDPDLHPRYPVGSVGGRGGEFMPMGRVAKEQLRNEIAVLEKAKAEEQRKLDLIRSKPRNPVTGNRAGVHQVEIARLDILIKARQAELAKGIEPTLSSAPAYPKGKPYFPHARGPAPKQFEEEKEQNNG